MDFEYIFESYIDKIKNIDIYLRNVYDNKNSLRLFPDKDNFLLYNDVDQEYIINNTRNMIIKVISHLNIKKCRKKIFYIFIACYVINIKYYSDCYFNRPYSFILEMLSHFDDISFLDKHALKNMIKMEKEIIPFLNSII